MIKKKNTAVMYGAGNIGRGFIGQIFADSGFEVVFIDIDPEIVSALNERGAYTQEIVENDLSQKREIIGVRAVDGRNKKAVADEIANCEIMAVSVGAAVLPYIAPMVADGLVKRTNPLNILVCENLAHAPEVFKEYVSGHLNDKSKLDKVGFIGTSIGRMVPVMPPQQTASDPTLITVEAFCTLPIDKDAIIEPMPELKHTVKCSPFAFEEGKKLYIHNMGHAIAAYLGALKGYKFIWQTVEDDEIYSNVHNAMSATGQALVKKYSDDIIKVTSYMNDLLSRFGNKGLGDTVARVGGDPMRKLAPDDRLAGALNLCKEQNIDYNPILAGIAAAIKYNAADDLSAGKLQEKIQKTGASVFLKEYSKLSDNDISAILAEYKDL